MLKKQDLPINLQEEYVQALATLGKDETWGEVALNLKPLEDWKKYNSMGLFLKDSFIKQVDNKLKNYVSITADDVKKEVDARFEKIERAIRKIGMAMNELNNRIEVLENDRKV